MTTIALDELLHAVEYVTAGGDASPVEAWVCLASGRLLVRDSQSGGELHWRDDPDERTGLPDDPDGMEQFVPVPSRRDLDLGRVLALRYAREYLPEDFEAVDSAFQAPGAYTRFKHLLERRDRLQHWHDYERATVGRELREWCEAVGLVLRDDRPDADPG